MKRFCACNISVESMIGNGRDGAYLIASECCKSVA